MASRNEVKVYIENAHYHVYNRGVNGVKIFVTELDYRVFLNLLKRHLSDKPGIDKLGREHIWLYQKVKLEAYCLMGNHIHLLLYQVEKDAITSLLGAIMPTYVRYFNRIHGRYGPLFQGVSKASLIMNDSYLAHISRYIHMNPEEYRSYRWSSLAAYTGKAASPDWLRNEMILEDFANDQEYLDFLEDYEGYKGMLEQAKLELAD